MRVISMLLLIMFVVITGCDDTTGPNSNDDPPATQVDSVNVDYEGENNAVFYCLSTKAKTTIPHNVWDIAVDGSLNIVSNSGDYGYGVAVLSTGNTDFEADYSVYADSAFDGVECISFVDNDPFEGWMDYDPVTHEVSFSEEVFIVLTEDGTFYKVQFINATMMSGVSVTAKIDALSGTGAAEVTFAKDANYDKAYIDLATANMVFFAPMTTEWDLKFARGNQKIEIGGGQFVVHGMSAISLNTADNVQAYVLEETSFGDVTVVESSLFSDAINVIGCSWYTFSGQPDMIFTCDNDVSVINTEAGIYKLQMATFYGGPDGTKKFVSIFEFQEIE